MGYNLKERNIKVIFYLITYILIINTLLFISFIYLLPFFYIILISFFFLIFGLFDIKSNNKTIFLLSFINILFGVFLIIISIFINYNIIYQNIIKDVSNDKIITIYGYDNTFNNITGDINNNFLSIKDVENVINDINDNIIDKKNLLNGIDFNIVSNINNSKDFFNIFSIKNDLILGYYDIKNTDIYFDPIKIYLGKPIHSKNNVIYHEIGHWFHFNIISKEDFKELKELYNNCPGSVSKYAKTNYMEDFAELFTYYFTKKRILDIKIKSNYCIEKKYNILKKYIY